MTANDRVQAGFDVRPIRDYLKARIYAAGAPIFRQGDAVDGCYFIDAGEVRIEIETNAIDSDVVVTYMTAPAILGEVGLLDGMPRSASAVAHTDVRGRHLSSAALERMAHERPRDFADVLRALGRDAALKLRRSDAASDGASGLRAARS